LGFCQRSVEDLFLVKLPMLVEQVAAELYLL
jgi:hypothetical protein